MSTPVEVVRRYLEEIYHDGKVETIREITADPLVRHDPGSRTEMGHDQQIERIAADLAKHSPRFTHEVLAGDDRYAVLVWNCSGVGDRVLSGIEVFAVTDGRITDVWNNAYGTEHWA